MSRPLPVRLDPFRAAEQGRKIEGAVSLEKMQRLAELVAGSDRVATCSLEFYKAGARDPRVRGTIQVSLKLKCERCLGLYEYPFHGRFEVVLVTLEAEEGVLPDEIEPYLVSEDSLDIVLFVEDEILLGLPAIPKHPDEQSCNQRVMREFEPDDFPEGIAGDEKPNPFAVLESLKKH